jgi:hypothetical protein
MGGLTGVTVRRTRDPESNRTRPLRVGIRRREVAVDRFVTEVVMGDGEVVSGARPAPPFVAAPPPAPALPVARPSLAEAA